LPPYDLPLILLARLAVDRRFVGRRLGHALISEALKIKLRVADEVGCRCIIAEYAVDHLKRILGGKMLVDFNEAAVIHYQNARLGEKASPKSPRMSGILMGEPTKVPTFGYL